VKAVRAIAASSSLLLAAVLAHILAGGDSLTLVSSIKLLMALSVIAIFIGDTRANPVRVILAIFIAQNAGHFIAGSTTTNENRMAISHIFAGFLSYQLLRYFDHSLPKLSDVFIAYVIPAISAKVEVKKLILSHPCYTYRSLATPFYSLTQSLRAPPSY
jgi:hypothetical protein